MKKYRSHDPDIMENPKLEAAFCKLLENQHQTPFVAEKSSLSTFHSNDSNNIIETEEEGLRYLEKLERWRRLNVKYAFFCNYFSGFETLQSPQAAT